MKKLLLKILQKILKFLAKAVIRKYQPDVIGITGSIGKTSAKEGIFAVLNGKFNVRKNLKNYNNEIGVPLSILGMESGRANPWQWFKIFWQTLKKLLVIDNDFPQILILEMGADKKGDIGYLTAIAKPKVAVVTAIAPVHLEFFGTLENVIKEKKKIMVGLKKDDWLVYNLDDEKVRGFTEATNARKISFGMDEKADLQGREEKISALGDHWGMSFKLFYKGNMVPVFLPDVLGKPQIYAVLAGAALGLIYELNLLEISDGLKKYLPAKSRLHLLPGLKQTLLIDDSYNSSPRACLEAINILSEFPLKEPGKRWAVLGDMLELGSFTEEGHLTVGQRLTELKNIDYLVTVGEKSKDIKKGAVDAGFTEDRIYSFKNSLEAGAFIQEQMDPGDLILIKGSQGIRMEKITKEIMAEPQRSEELLCRQEAEWLNK